MMRRLPDGFDGNTCPFIFTWSTERPNKVWGMGSGCSAYYNTVRIYPKYPMEQLTVRSTRIPEISIVCSFFFFARSLSHTHTHAHSLCVRRTKKVQPTHEWTVSLKKIALRFTLNVRVLVQAPRTPYQLVLFACMWFACLRVCILRVDPV
jgi:hypothetical protein